MSKEVARTTPRKRGALASQSARPDVKAVASAITLNEQGRGLDINLSGEVGQTIGGSEIHSFNATMLQETLATVWIEGEPGSEARGANSLRAGRAVAAALHAFQPKDEIEGMLAAQATAMHFASMECFRRAALGGQPTDAASKLRRDGANLARGMSDMLETLNRKRGKGPRVQVVRVERVVVESGANAIVGAVTPAAGAAAMLPEEREGAEAQPPRRRQGAGVGRRA